MTSRYPPPYTGQYPPELHVLHGENAGYKSQDLLQQPGREHASLSTPGQCTAFVATQGWRGKFSAKVHLVAANTHRLHTSRILPWSSQKPSAMSAGVEGEEKEEAVVSRVRSGGQEGLLGPVPTPTVKLIGSQQQY